MLKTIRLLRKSASVSLLPQVIKGKTFPNPKLAFKDTKKDQRSLCFHKSMSMSLDNLDVNSKTENQLKSMIEMVKISKSFFIIFRFFQNNLLKTLYIM
jgi:hypothetical protein